MAHPSIDTSGFETGTGFVAYLERNRAHALAAETGYRAAAAEIRSLVRAAGSGQDRPMAIMNARRISRPLLHAADLQLDEARMFSLCLSIYRGAFPPVHATGTRRAHNPHA